MSDSTNPDFVIVDSVLERYKGNDDCVVIPEGVTCIEKHAFYYNNKFTAIVIPKSVVSIEEDAFSKCQSIKAIYISDMKSWCEGDYQSLPSPGSADLYLNGELVTDLVIPDNVTSIQSFAFYGIQSITSVTLPDTLTSIGTGVFNNCYHWKPTVIDGIKYVASKNNPQFAVLGTADLSFGLSLTVPDGVKLIAGEAFNDSFFSAGTLPDSVTNVGNAAFFQCSCLTSVQLPNAITTIGESTFNLCKELEEIHIPDSVTTIGEFAFSGCESLASIHIPTNVSSIGYNAFVGCTALTAVHISDLAAWCEIDFFGGETNPLSHAKTLYLNGQPITDLVIPDGVKHIGRYAFMNCESLTSVTFPDSVETVGTGAFAGCTNIVSVSGLEHITFEGPSKPFETNSLSNPEQLQALLRTIPSKADEESQSYVAYSQADRDRFMAVASQYEICKKCVETKEDDGDTVEENEDFHRIPVSLSDLLICQGEAVGVVVNEDYVLFFDEDECVEYSEYEYGYSIDYTWDYTVYLHRL